MNRIARILAPALLGLAAASANAAGFVSESNDYPMTATGSAGAAMAPTTGAASASEASLIADHAWAGASSRTRAAVRAEGRAQPARAIVGA